MLLICDLKIATAFQAFTCMASLFLLVTVMMTTIASASPVTEGDISLVDKDVTDTKPESMDILPIGNNHRWGSGDPWVSIGSVKAGSSVAAGGDGHGGKRGHLGRKATVRRLKVNEEVNQDQS